MDTKATKIMTIGSQIAKQQIKYNHQIACVDDIENALVLIGEKMCDSKLGGKRFAEDICDTLGDFDLSGDSDNADWWSEFYAALWKRGEREGLLPDAYYQAKATADDGEIATTRLNNLHSALAAVMNSGQWGE